MQSGFQVWVLAKKYFGFWVLGFTRVKKVAPSTLPCSTFAAASASLVLVSGREAQEATRWSTKVSFGPESGG